MNELLIGPELPSDKFEGDIWPATDAISIRMASHANAIGRGGGHTMADGPQYAGKHFSKEEI